MMPGIGVQLRAESLFTFGRNGCSRSSGIRSLLDEQQRRLFAGLESIKLGLGGDTILATFLNVDAHTVARGRQQLLDHDVASGRVRRGGGGRPLAEKKRPTSSP